VEFVHSVKFIVTCLTAYKRVTARTEGSRPKVTLMN